MVLQYGRALGAAVLNVGAPPRAMDSLEPVRREASRVSAVEHHTDVVRGTCSNSSAHDNIKTSYHSYKVGVYVEL